jgi:hypothetical protein
VETGGRVVEGGVRVGYFRAAEPAVLADLEADEPIFREFDWNGELWV